MRKIIAALAALGLLLTGCAAGETGSTGSSDGIKVVATIFPAFDWAANLMDGTGVTPALLMKNGVDMHSFQPTAADIV